MSNDQTPSRVVGYLRVASPEQGCSLALQRREIDRWAEAKRIYVAAVFQDEGTAESDRLERRAGLAEALAVMAELKGSGLVVYRRDRLDPEPLMQVLIEEELRRLGGKVYSTLRSESKQPIDHDEQRQALVRQTLESSPKYRQTVTALRLRVGRLRKRRSGGYAYGAPPTGFRAVAGELVPDPAEQRILERAQELRAGGASLRNIAAALTSEGYSTRRGGRWQPTQVARVLQRAGRTPEYGAAKPT